MWWEYFHRCGFTDTSGFAAPKDLVAQDETPLNAVRRIAPQLDCSVLPVQGPPGSGKIYTGARVILDLLAGEKRVGVTPNSHKVCSPRCAPRPTAGRSRTAGPEASRVVVRCGKHRSTCAGSSGRSRGGRAAFDARRFWSAPSAL